MRHDASTSIWSVRIFFWEHRSFETFLSGGVLRRGLHPAAGFSSRFYTYHLGAPDSSVPETREDRQECPALW